MATKPLQTPEWASAGTNNTEPSLAQKQSGWNPNQDGISDYDNWYKELVYRWCQYLSDGDLDGPITVDGTLTATTLAADDLDVDTLTVNVLATLAKADVTGEVRQGARRRGHSVKPLFGYGTGTVSHSFVSQLESLTFSDQNGKAFFVFEEYKPGDKITGIRLAFETPAPSPDVRCYLAGAYNFTQIGGNCTVGLQESPAGAGTTKVVLYTPNLGPITLDHKLHGTPLSAAWARRFGIEVEAQGINTILHGIEVIYEHTDIPADDA